MRPIVHIHIPKTGGTWLNGALSNVLSPDLFPFKNLGHFAVGYALDGLLYFQPLARWVVDDQGVQIAAIPKDKKGNRHGLYDFSTKVSICRNPFEILVSYYTHDWGRDDHASLAGLDENHPIGWDGINAVHGIKSFDGFIKRFCDPGFRWLHAARQHHLFFQLFEMNTGKCGVDIIFRQERLFEGVSFFLDHYEYCDIAKLEEHRNKRSNETPRKKKDYRSYYTDQLRELVEVKCAEELNQFQYNFDGSTTDELYVDPEDLSISWQPKS